MVSNAISPDIRPIGYIGDGNCLYYECNDLNVCSNWQSEIMLYTGQLLLLDNASKNAARTTPTQRSKRSDTRTPISPKQDQNTAACSKIFSALKVADIEFKSSSTTSTTTATTAGSTPTNTTDSSSAATSTYAKTPTSKTQSTPCLQSFNFSSSSPASSKKLENVSFVGANGLDESSSTKSSFVGPQKPKTTVAQLEGSAGKLGDASSIKGSKKKDNPTPVLSKALENAKQAAKDLERAANDNVGASKFPFSSNLEDHLKLRNETQFCVRKNVTARRKVKSDEKDERDVDSSPGKQRCEGRKEEKSNSLPKELLRAQLRCFQIQHSLYQVLVAKLRSKAESELQATSQLSRDSESDDLHSLLLPLETLLRCSDIQLGLHHSLNVALCSEEGRSQDGGDGCGYNNKENTGRLVYDKDELLIESRSLMNHTKFAQSLVCLHLTNPYSLNPIYASGEDRIFSYDSFFRASNAYVPHGEGKLVSFDGNLIYEGQWKKGKRWGYGKAFIFSGTELSASKKQYGIYEGQWWNNMRHGHGRLVFASCAVYEGEWQYDLRSGVGAMHSPDGTVLEGLWDEDEPSGCCMFTWPNGSMEYREYQNAQVVKVLESSEEMRKISPLNEVIREYSILRLKYQMLEEDKTRLVQAESRMMAEQSQVEHSKQANQAKIKELRGEFTKLLRKEKKKILEKHQEDLREANERHDKNIKDLEDKIHQIEEELEHKKSDLLCQICFERYRDCILMPCSHLLYCQICIAKLHARGNARCPACRGSINSQINCNLNQLE